MTFDSTQNSFWYYTGAAWKELSGNNYNSDSALLFGQQTGTITSHNMTGNSSSSDSSGYLYDSGGPSGSYGNNENFEYVINNFGNKLATDIIVLSNNLESLYDSLIIFDNSGHRYILLGTTTGSYRFIGPVTIQFKTNFVNTASGFAIRWNGVFPGTKNNYDSSQISGWYFNPEKSYMRGGVNANNNWSPDSSGITSFAFGYNNKAKGFSSTALGINTTAYANYSTAMGANTTASGSLSTAMGAYTTASGFSSTAMGASTIASGTSSTAMGDNTTASGSYSTAMGKSTISSGSYSTAMGFGPAASGMFSTAMGSATKAMGNYSTAMGYGTTASGTFSSALGTNTSASGDHSIAMGYNIKSKSYVGLSIGLFNDSTNAASASSYNPLNRIFQIGNGTADNARSNAITVLQNGNVGIGELNPAVPLNFASSLGNKISLWGNGTDHFGLGIQSSLMQVYTNSYFSDIGFGFGNSGAFTETMRIKGNGNMGIGTNNPSYMLTVKNDINVDNGDANAGTTTNTLKFGGNGTGESIGSNRTTVTNQWGLDFYTNNVNRMAITLSGNVGIGTTGPTAKLSVNGTANNATGNWGVFSDARIKTISSDFTDGLNVIRQLNPVVFTYNDNAPFKTTDKQIGIVAQDLEKMAPYMVSKQAYNQFADLREVNNQAYIFLLINAVKEQQQQITNQQQANAALQQQYIQQQQHIDKLEKLIADLSRKVN
jgi:hypothetical protein